MTTPTDAWLVLASGPSAQRVDLSRYRADRTICVNDSWRLRPDAYGMLAADLEWWEEYLGAVRAGFGGYCYTTHAVAGERFAKHLYYVPLTRSDRLSEVPMQIVRPMTHGANSAAQAMQLAWHLGAREIHLGGVDLCAVNGATHWFGEHPAHIDRRHRMWDSFRDHIASLARDMGERGGNVVNLSPYSVIENTGIWP